MKINLKHWVSPSFDHRKLEPPFYKDVVDVFEDRMRGWLLKPALQLLESKDFSIASVSLATSYFEGIEIYFTGASSQGKSAAFFKRGFARVFQVRNQPGAIQEIVAARLYELLRCGFAHDSIFRSGIFFTTVRPEPVLVSQRKINGVFDATAKPEAIIIHPRLFVEGIERHFAGYVRQLRKGTDEDLVNKFKAAIDIKWRLGESGPYVGMTEDQFLSGELPP